MRKTSNSARSPLKATQWRKRGVIVPKDDDGAYRVHERLDGMDITGQHAQAYLKKRAS